MFGLIFTSFLNVILFLAWKTFVPGLLTVGLIADSILLGLRPIGVPETPARLLSPATAFFILISSLSATYWYWGGLSSSPLPEKKFLMHFVQQASQLIRLILNSCELLVSFCRMLHRIIALFHLVSNSVADVISFTLLNPCATLTVTASLGLA